MEDTLSLQDIFETIKKRLLLIAILTLITTLLSACVTYFILTPIYQSSTQILVNQSNKNGTNILDSNQIQTNIQLINTYSVIIKSPTILDEVSKQIGKKVSDTDVTVTSANNSQVFTVSVQDPDPLMAVKEANTIALVFQTQIQQIMNVDNVSILSKAQLPPHSKPISPKPVLNIAIGFIVGLMMGVGLAFLIRYLDKTINAEQDVVQFLNLPVLAVITEIGRSEIRELDQLRVKNVRGESIRDVIQERV